jgi:hypothetical protein
VQKHQSCVRVIHLANMYSTLCGYTKKIIGVLGKLRTLYNPFYYEKG